MPKKRLKLSARAVRERDGNRCQYAGALLRPDEGGLDHVVPRSRGDPVKLLNELRASKELPVTALLRNAHGIAEWKLSSMNETTGGRVSNLALPKRI